MVSLLQGLTDPHTYLEQTKFCSPPLGRLQTRVRGILPHF